MKKIAVFLVLALFIFSIPVLADNVVVRVQDYELTESEFLETSEEMKSQLDAPEEVTDDEIDAYIAEAIIEDFIIDSLIRIDIEKRDLEVDDKLVRDELDSFLEDAVNEQEFENKEDALSQIESVYGLSESDLKETIRDNLSYQKLQLFYAQKAQKEMTQREIEADYEDYESEELSLEEFTERRVMEEVNRLMQQRVNELYGEFEGKIEINL